MYSHLIIVACHAVFILPSNTNELTANTIRQLKYWHLDIPPQSTADIPSYLAHISKGLDMLKEDGNAVLMFTGGKTKKNAGPVSEAYSYRVIASIMLQQNATLSIKQRHSIESRIFLEEYARDSLENLAFSVCKYHDVFRTIPTKITFISYPFKEERIASLHRGALGIPEDMFRFVGVCDQKEGLPALDSAFKDFYSDPYGTGEKLTRKRVQRNPFLQIHDYKFDGLFKFNRLKLKTLNY